MAGLPERAVRAASLWAYLNEQNTWQNKVAGISQDGPNLNNTTTATSLLAASSKIIVPKSLYVVGRVLRLKAAGRINTVVTTPGTFTFDIRLTGASTVIVATGGAMSLNIVAKSNVTWFLEWLLTVRAVGATANFMHQGKWVSEAVIGSPLPTVGGSGSLLIPTANPVVGANFDSGVDQTLDLFGKWSIADASNQLAVHQFSLEQVTS